MKTIRQPSLRLKPGKDGCGGHAWECKSAKSPIADCVCACDGKNHGINRPMGGDEYAGITKQKFVPGLFFDEDTCIDCGGQLGPYVDGVAIGTVSPAEGSTTDAWWYRECTKCEYAWAEWKLVARGFQPHAVRQ